MTTLRRVVLLCAAVPLTACGVVGGPDFPSLSLPMNAAIFVAAGIVVWLAGTRLSRYVNAIAERTGIGRAFLGALLLGGITSLPEVATSVTASVAGDPGLAVNNIFGSIAMNVLLLAIVADVVDGGRALTSLVQKPMLIMQAALSILVIAAAASATMMPAGSIRGVGIGSAATFAVAVVSFYLTHRLRPIQRWVPAEQSRGNEGDGEEGESIASSAPGDDAPGTAGALSTSRLVAYTGGVATVILVAGFFLSRSASAIAAQTGIGSSMMGFVLVAFGTSLPEISTLTEAVRLGRFGLAFSEVFGTNIFNSSILFLTDVAYRGGPLLEQVGPFSSFAALLGIMMTAVYIVGLVTRSAGTSIGRLGKDSVAVILLYAAGAVVLYQLR